MIVSSTLLPVKACTHMLDRCLTWMATTPLLSEYLEGGKCKRKVIGWSQGILDQLDVGHRKQFPTIITHNYACDMRVVRLLRQCGFGNSSTQLHKKLVHDLFLALSF